jgi:heme-degrading monooxygenase HmoA
MWARVSSYSFDPSRGDEIDEGIRRFERSIDQIRGLDGVRDAYLLVDRSTGKALTMTLWESEDALTASEEVADRVRRDAAGDAVRDVDRYEVAMHETFA